MFDRTICHISHGKYFKNLIILIIPRRISAFPIKRSLDMYATKRLDIMQEIIITILNSPERRIQKANIITAVRIKLITIFI